MIWVFEMKKGGIEKRKIRILKIKKDKRKVEITTKNWDLAFGGIKSWVKDSILFYIILNIGIIEPLFIYQRFQKLRKTLK